MNGNTPYSEVELETCKSSLIFEVIEKEQTPSDASQESLLSYFRGTPKDYNRYYHQVHLIFQHAFSDFSID